MADAEAARAARETSVSDERHLFARALPIKRRGRRQHLAHARSAARALVANDDDVAVLVVASSDRRETIFLGIEAAGGTGELVTLEAGDLHDRAVRCEVALQANDAAGRGQRLVRRVNDVLVRIPFHVLEILGNRAAGHCHAVAVQEAVVEQRLHEQRHAARLEHVLGNVLSARLHVGDVRRLLEDFGDVEEVEFNAALVRHGRQVQRAVGGAAGGSDDGRGILQRLAGDDVARADVAGEQFHHHLAGGHTEAVADFVGSGSARRIGEREADRLGDASHCVGRELAATSASRRARDLFEQLQIFVGHLADRVQADGLEDVDDGHVPALEGAGQDRAAVDENRRHVKAQHRHHHAGQRLVAAGHADQCIVRVAAHR